jgi:uncharacterized membrane protein YebE (DUF533 family)
MAIQEEHALSAAWFYAEHFGFSQAPSLSDREVTRNMALAVLAVAQADGVVSPEERAWLVGYFAAKGYPSDVLADVVKLPPPRVEDVPKLMDSGILRMSRRILIYDAIRAASADSYHPLEKAAVQSIAAALGVDPATVDEIERLVAEEESLKRKRIQLLVPKDFPYLNPRYRP